MQVDGHNSNQSSNPENVCLLLAVFLQVHDLYPIRRKHLKLLDI